MKIDFGPAQSLRAVLLHVVSRDRWHHELLEKMFLDLSSLRPAVLPGEAKSLLRDLLGLRHLFRHACEYTLDQHKVIVLSRQWLAQSGLVFSAVRSFCDQLGQVPPG